MKVLIIDDEKLFTDSLREKLQESMTVNVAYNGHDGIALSGLYRYDFILIDLVLPDISGIEVCREIRSRDTNTYILFITVKSNIKDKVDALDAGGDDYLVKPFSYHELCARIRALSRRNIQLIDVVLLKADNLQLDLVSRKVTRGNQDIFLRRKEFDLLEFMLKNQNHVLTREIIMDYVWFNQDELNSNTLDVHIKNLRDKIDKPFSKKMIKTVHGLGYMLENY